MVTPGLRNWIPICSCWVVLVKGRMTCKDAVDPTELSKVLVLCEMEAVTDPQAVQHWVPEAKV
jgi:hypothetical protein